MRSGGKAMSGQARGGEESALGGLGEPAGDVEDLCKQLGRQHLPRRTVGGKAALAAQGVDFESGMPGFGDQLTDDQIWNILAYIKSTWPDRQRQIQAERSAAEAQREGN